MTIEDEAKAAAEKRYYMRNDQCAFEAGYIAGANRPTGETFDEDTLRKVHDALRVALLNPDTSVADIVSAMQNVGILFRERAPEPAPARTLHTCETCGETVPLSHVTEEWEARHQHDGPAPADEREAMKTLRREVQAIMEDASMPVDVRSMQIVLLARQRLTRHPQPTEGEPSDAQVLAALNAWDPRFATDDLDDYAPEHIADMRAALRAAWGVADQEGESR